MKKLISMLSALLIVSTAPMNAQTYECAPCPTPCEAPCDPCCDPYGYSSYGYAPVGGVRTGMNTASLLVGVVVIAGITGGIIYAATSSSGHNH